ncbi:MAG: two-component system sensor histidine kinase/response regulator [Candidatus Azotimanducaceae bacterium]|jgi:two-component system sensor histidine kinase/response regulator
MSDLNHQQYCDKILDNLHAGLIILDANLRIVTVNQWLAEHAGRLANDMIGADLAELFGLDPSGRMVTACRDVIELGLPTVLSNRLNSSPLPLYYKTTRAATSTHKPHRIEQRISINRIERIEDSNWCQIIVEDLTSAVAKDNTLRRFADENKAAMKTAEIANALKSEFLATMSHEIRTPMNGVLGMLELLNRTDQSQNQQHYTNLAKNSANSLLSILNDILDFSKIESGKLDLDMIEFDLLDLVNETTQANAIRSREKDLELVLDSAQLTTPIIHSDPHRIRQIINNLVGNAIKFTASGEVIVSVSSKKIDGTSTMIDITVRDTGIGIKSEVLPTLFENFVQAGASTTRKFGGTGLGLAITKKLAELLGGSINVDSTYGVGSEFSFRFPAVLGEHSRSNINFDQLRVLVIVDNQSTRFAIKRQLLSWSTQVICVASDSQALKVLEQSDTQHFDAAIIDMQLPEIDGTELSHRIRSQNRKKELHLIMFTSMEDLGDTKVFADQGFSAYLPKPATATDLSDALQIVKNGGPLDKAILFDAIDHVSVIPPDNQQQEKKRHRILVAEDNMINQEVIIGLLEDDYVIDAVEDGLEALDALKRAQNDQPYDLVLMDCQMPNLDGYETTRRIRQGVNGINQTDIVIIALTANAMLGDRESCLEAGMNEHVSKPIDPDKLNSVIESFLEIDPRRIS